MVNLQTGHEITISHLVLVDLLALDLIRLRLVFLACLMSVHFILLDGAFGVIPEGIECQRVANLVFMNASSSRDLLLAQLPILAFTLTAPVS